MIHKQFFARQVFTLLLVITFFFLPKSLKAQINHTEGLGGSIGLSFSLGAIQNSLGIVIKGYYFYEQVQFNFQTNWRYNFSTYGPTKKSALPKKNKRKNNKKITGKEVQTNFGLVFGWGKQTKEFDYQFLLPFGNQMQRLNSLGYAFNMYIDEKKTSQTSGTISFQANRFWLVTENDALGDIAVDKFRTGGVWMAYRLENTLLALNTRLWTGNSNNTPIIKNTDYPSQYGYRDMSKAAYGRYSHGILTLQVFQALPYGQMAMAEIGLDAERVRHFLQNQLMHDLYFVPRKWNPSQNPHIPMLNDKGGAYLFRKDQRLKPVKGVFHLALNPTLFY